MSGVKMVILQPKVPYVQLSNVRFSEPHCTWQVRYLDLVYTLFTLVASLKKGSTWDQTFWRLHCRSLKRPFDPNRCDSGQKPHSNNPANNGNMFFLSWQPKAFNQSDMLLCLAQHKNGLQKNKETETQWKALVRTKESVEPKWKIYSRLSRSNTARGSCTTGHGTCHIYTTQSKVDDLDHRTTLSCLSGKKYHICSI